ncbi:hypothetical protein FB384_004242 [Prauserella sediminis]|uniref:PucR family transcriptional regulator n=2 Tax=Prauserella sediminis TaxID=577680 RepID=A0A839XTD2_9PSEU|nr:hypothetical protein [Prauserella sediminis]
MTSMAMLPEPAPATRELARRLLARAPELANLLRDTIVQNDDVYATTDRVAPKELLRSCRDNMLRSLQSLSGQVPDGDDLFDAARLTARRRADAGFPLESLLHAFRLGTEVLWAALLDEARTSAPDALGELLDGAVQVMQLMDVMSLATATEYRARQSAAQRRDSERRQAVLEGLLDGRGGDPLVADEANRVLGLTSTTRLAVVVVGHAGPSTSPSHSPADALTALGFASQWQLRADREVGLVELGSAPLSRLVGQLGRVVEGKAGVSPAFTGLTESASAYRLAELALDTVPEGRSMVAAFEDRLPEALLAANRPIADRIQEHALGQLLVLDPDKRDLLLRTLDCWFRRDGAATEVGDELNCHRNTVLQRLARIEALTGRSLRDHRDQLLLRLAVLDR